MAGVPPSEPQKSRRGDWFLRYGATTKSEIRVYTFSPLRSRTTHFLARCAATVTESLLSSAVEFTIVILASLLDGIEIRGSVHEAPEFCNVVTCVQPIDHIATVWKIAEHQHFRTQRCHFWII